MATITTTTVLPAKCAETHHVKNPKRVAAGKALAARNKEKLAQIKAFEEKQNNNEARTIETQTQSEKRTIETQTYPEMRSIETQTD